IPTAESEDDTNAQGTDGRSVPTLPDSFPATPADDAPDESEPDEDEPDLETVAARNTTIYCVQAGSLQRLNELFGSTEQVMRIGGTATTLAIRPRDAAVFVWVPGNTECGAGGELARLDPCRSTTERVFQSQDDIQILSMAFDDDELVAVTEGFNCLGVPLPALRTTIQIPQQGFRPQGPSGGSRAVTFDLQGNRYEVIGGTGGAILLVVTGPTDVEVSRVAVASTVQRIDSILFRSAGSVLASVSETFRVIQGGRSVQQSRLALVNIDTKTGATTSSRELTAPITAMARGIPCVTFGQ
ncbi:MAG: hypothetical protein AAF517_15610, partial [Planctomycetota bacterium]